jgi:spore germination protein YaaH
MTQAFRILAIVVIGTSLTLGCGARTRGTEPRTHVWAFTVPWDTNSVASARANTAALDAIISGWIQLDSITGQPFAEFHDRLARSDSQTPLMAIVTNAVGGRFHPDAVRLLGSSTDSLARAAGEVARRLSAGRYRGMVLDLEGLRSADRDLTTRVARAIIDSARSRGIAPIAVAVPATDTAAFPGNAFIPAADYLLVMLYDQHWSTSPPGSIASPTWVRRALARRVAEVGASHVVAALPLYGYRWPISGAATAITFGQAQRDIGAAGTVLTRDSTTQMLHATKPGAWELWVSDAGLLAALMREVAAQGVGTIALWRLGQEDPLVWDVLARRRPQNSEF